MFPFKEVIEMIIVVLIGAMVATVWGSLWFVFTSSFIIDVYFKKKEGYIKSISMYGLDEYEDESDEEIAAYN